jgi:hypothetical protein
MKLQTRYKGKKLKDQSKSSISLPVVIFISVLQKNEREERVGLPSKHGYTHCSDELDGLKAWPTEIMRESL